ncbi:epididymal-specific lipocalin-6 [Carlito syrichta]|uniref:Epididymal-specific lipocalin-6 n=1 Tax=Carlito syrichta TaxID=1868482 RepID=A0A1U7U5A1_CARSF|nr:epididymal-specific lipocalin-6 [Carlito syrichta]
MGGLLLTALLTLACVPWAQVAWLERLDPKQFLGPWYILAVASYESGYALQREERAIQGVRVTFTPENNLQMLWSRHGQQGCNQSIVELLKRDAGWVYENPSIGVLEYRVLSTNFKDYAIIFTQLDFGDESLNAVELYSRTETASQEAMKVFTNWSRGLGFVPQEQSQLQKDSEGTAPYAHGGRTLHLTLGLVAQLPGGGLRVGASLASRVPTHFLGFQ